MAESCGFEPKILNAVEERNQSQKLVLFDKVVARFGADLSGLTFGVWGLAFKPGTDDMREASSLVLINSFKISSSVLFSFLACLALQLFLCFWIQPPDLR